MALRCRNSTNGAVPTTPAPIDLAARILAVRTELAALEAEYADRAHGTWLHAIYLSTRGRSFTARELVAHARVDRDLAAALETVSARKIGKRLRALAGRAWGGWCVTCAEGCREGDGRVWSVHIHASSRHDDGDAV